MGRHRQNLRDFMPLPDCLENLWAYVPLDHECRQQSGLQNGPLSIYSWTTWELVTLDMDACRPFKTFTHRPIWGRPASSPPDTGLPSHNLREKLSSCRKFLLKTSAATTRCVKNATAATQLQIPPCSRLPNWLKNRAGLGGRQDGGWKSLTERKSSTGTSTPTPHISVGKYSCFW